MESVASRLPVVLGAFAALIVAFLSMAAQVTAAVCVLRAVAAFSVFAAFGIVIRYLLGDAADTNAAKARPVAPPETPEGHARAMTVEEMLAAEEKRASGETH